jgi:phosphoglycolate phosphatase
MRTIAELFRWRKAKSAIFQVLSRQAREPLTEMEDSKPSPELPPTHARMRPTILLFDIDGTLITTGGVGRKALERAFLERFGRDDATRFPFDGMTDRLIARLGLEALGVAPTAEAIAQILEFYVELLAEEVARADAAKYRLHAGITEALAAAEERGCGIGLGTGNVRAGARIKLERLGVHERFAFGGFGCDAEERVELIRHGAERGAAHLGAPLSTCRVVVIGDTPKDVAAAQGIGAESIGVGTGSFSAAALSECGATHAFASLSEPGALAALLDG